MRKLLGMIALLTLLAALLSGCGSEKKTDTEQTGEATETVKIAYLPITHALPVLATKELTEQGKLQGNIKTELVKFSSWSELTDALNAGRVDGASVLIELALKAKEQGIDLKLAALGHHDGNVVVAAPGIKKATALKGKTIAIPHRQSSHNILVQQMLKKAGLGISDVKIIELPPPEMPSALAQKQIDAYCVAEPFGAKAVTMGVGKVLYESKDLWKDSLCCGLVFNNAYIKAHPETAKAYTTQYRQGGDYLADNPDTALQITKKNLSVDDATLQQSLQWISYNNLSVVKNEYDSLTEKMVKFGLTKTPPKYEDFVATELSQ